jgi:ADP-ribosylglycohydrolase
MPEKMRVDIIQASATNLSNETTDDFERRVKLANLILKEQELKTKENIVEAQMNKKVQ